MLRRHWPFALVLAAGGLLRVACEVAYRPALFYSDSWGYLAMAHGSGVVSFADGQTTASLRIQVLDDFKVDSDTGFFVNFSNPTGGASLSPNDGVAEVTGRTVSLTANGASSGITGQIGFSSGGVGQFFEVSATTLNASTNNSRLWISAIGGTAIGSVNAGTNTAFLRTFNGNLTSTHTGATPDVMAAVVNLSSPGTSGSHVGGARHASHLRGLNLDRVLTVAMARTGTFTRAELSDATGLSGPTVGGLAAG